MRRQALRRTELAQDIAFAVRPGFFAWKQQWRPPLQHDRIQAQFNACGSAVDRGGWRAGERLAAKLEAENGAMREDPACFNSFAVAGISVRGFPWK